MQAPWPSATVILLRECAGSPQLLLLERHAKSPAFPAMSVFPGGRVESADGRWEDRLGDFDTAAAQRLVPTVPASLALAYCVAAVRETFEESGLLLARARGGGALDAARARSLQTLRPAVCESAARFRELVEREDLELALDALQSHGHWITPEGVRHRFDTVFFTALAPPDQQATHDGVESASHVWLSPAEALEQGRRGERRLVFPTACNLESLRGFASAAEALEASRRRELVRVTPTLVLCGDRPRVQLPEGSGYRVAAGFEHPGVR